MKRLLVLPFLALAGILHLSATERVAPTLPEARKLESGKDYYLYNAEAGLFLTNNEKAELAETGKRFTITNTDGGNYTVKLTPDGDYLSRNTNTYFYYSYSSYCDWSIEATTSGDNGYLIKNPSADATPYFGCQSEENTLSYKCSTSDEIVWYLIDGDEGDLYCARVRLYNALEAMDGTNYDIAKFEAIYDNAESTAEEVNNAAAVLSNGLTLTSSYTFPDWNDYPILLEPQNDGTWYNYSSTSNTIHNESSDTPSTLSATVVIDGDATLCYETEYGTSMTVLLDGVETRVFGSEQLSLRKRYFVELSAGKHTIEWVVNTGGNYIYNIGVESTPLITVNLLEPGSLGTEILYNVDHLNKVRRLKVIGKMNDDDWEKIDMMKENLFSLDLSEAEITEISDNRFWRSDNDWQFLHSVKLPEGLLSIGRYAFYNAYLDDINFPSTLESIENSAFGETNISKAFLPEGCTTLGESIFNGCKFLTESSLPNSLKKVPDGMYNECYLLKTFALPESLQVIGYSAFMRCYNSAFDIPESVTSIESMAFFQTNTYGEKTRLIIPKNVVNIESGAFNGCNKYTYAELPVGFYNITESYILPTSIDTLRLNCPTVITNSNIAVFDNDASTRANVTLLVPTFLVNSYKLNSYWYTYKEIVGFDTDEIDEWVLNSDLVLGARDRFNNTPTVTINTSGSLKVNGEDGMGLKDLTIKIYPDGSKYGRMFSNADEVTVNGDLGIQFAAGTTNKWYFLSLPFNVKVSDITPEDSTAKCAIRYYDGANRAANGASGNWKNFASDDIIPAGTGFIFQTSKAGLWYIPTQEDESKQYLSSNNVFVKALEANEALDASNAGWNLVGNPYQAWYNIHKLNFTAPITVREGSSYSAYSVIDDDYAIAPNQAFFVQRPEGISSISFPLDGRQMTSTIEDQNGAKPRYALSQQNERRLVDLTVTANGESDRTRIVLNDQSTEGYDLSMDASKFMADAANVPQIYSYDNDGTRYAINERPEADGRVRLGFVAGESGCFTFSLTRNSAEKVLLVDNEKSLTIDLTAQDYDFTAEAGTYENRFELRLSTGVANGIGGAESDMPTATVADGGIRTNGAASVYNTAGMKVAETSQNGGLISLPAGIYVVKTSAGAQKVTVK